MISLLLTYLLDELGDCWSPIQFPATALVVTNAFGVRLPSMIYIDTGPPATQPDVWFSHGSETVCSAELWNFTVVLGSQFCHKLCFFDGSFSLFREVWYIHDSQAPMFSATILPYFGPFPTNLLQRWSSKNWLPQLLLLSPHALIAPITYCTAPCWLCS